MIIQCFIPFLFFVLLNIWTVYIGKKNFGISLPVTLMLTALSMFASQFLFCTFNVAFWILIVVAVAAIPLTVIKFRDKLFKKRLISNGYYTFW